MADWTLLVVGGVLTALSLAYAAITIASIEPRMRFFGVVGVGLPWISAFIVAIGLGWRP